MAAGSIRYEAVIMYGYGKLAGARTLARLRACSKAGRSRCFGCRRAKDATENGAQGNNDVKGNRMCYSSYDKIECFNSVKSIC